ncbi:MAG: type II toxin-antitoxin system RelE/ParE family toxin [Bacteroidales bacterium]|nr:type II toxin-antitoxin system RelE/ParE family toxin [Bacteroidales bacterium]
MVVEWTDTALSVADKTLIYTYFTYGQMQADKLRSEFRKVTQRIERFPRLGPVEYHIHKEGEYRYIIIFKILKVIYRIDNPEHISIITIWDCRRNPDDLENNVSKN